jgi:LPXTG-motif cell wall-anchored protein
MVVYGGYDDSPGAQLLGVLLILAGIFFALKSRKKL